MLASLYGFVVVILCPEYFRSVTAQQVLRLSGFAYATIAHWLQPYATGMP